MKLYYLQGAIGNRELIESHKASLVKILQGDYSDKNLERLSGHDVYSFRVNDSARLLFAIEKINGVNCLLVLDYLPTHDYQKSSFLRSGVLLRYKERKIAEMSKAAASGHENEFQFLSVSAIDEKLRIDTEEGAELEYGGDLAYFQNHWVQLSLEQNDAYSLKLPALISGVAGSGKSLIISSWLASEARKADEEVAHTNNILFIAKSRLLIERMMQSFHALPLNNEARKSVTFKTYEMLMFEAGVSKELLVNFNYFVDWYQIHTSHQKEVRKAQSKSLLACKAESKDAPSYYPANEVYAEFLVASAHTLEAYQALGATDSAISKEHRVVLYDLFIKYVAHLEASKFIDLNFHPLPEGLANGYSMVFSDESQDYSSRQLENILQLAMSRNVLFCVDSHQNLNGVRSTRHYLLKKQVNHHVLNTSYRSDYKILAAANSLISLKQKLYGGLSDCHEALNMNPGAEEKQGLGDVRVMSRDELKAHAWLQAQSTQSYFAVITTEGRKDEARQLFPDCALVMTPEEAKGLEFPVIVSYGIGSHELYKEMREKLLSMGDAKQPQHEPKAGTRDERFWQPLNHMYVAWSRAQQLLVVCEPEMRKDDAIVQSIARLQGRKPLSDESLHLACSNWEEQLDVQINSDNMRLAKLIWTSKLKRPHEAFDEYVRCLLMPVCVTPRLSEVESYAGDGAAVALRESAVTASLKLSKPQVGQASTREAGTSASNAFSASAIQPIDAPAQETEKVPSKGLAIEDKIIDGLLAEFNERKFALSINLLDKIQFDYVKHEKGQKLFAYLAQNREAKKILYRCYMNQNPVSNFFSTLIKASSMLNTVPNLNQLVLNLGRLGSVKKKYQADVLKYGWDQRADAFLCAAVIDGDLMNIKFLLHCGGDLNRDVGNGDTLVGNVIKLAGESVSLSPFLAGAVVGSTKLSGHDASPAVSTLLSRNDYFWRVLKDLGASETGHYSTLRVIKEWGADLDKPNEKGCTPAYIAAQLGYDRDLRAIKDLGADLDKSNNNGETPAYIAAQLGHDSTLRVLKELGADLDKPNNSGVTPAYIAARFGHNSTLRVLKGLGADLDKPNNNGATPAYISAERGCDSTLCVLNELGADLHKPINNGVTPAFIAAQFAHDSTLRVLDLLGADLDKPNNRGITPALIAARLGQDSTLRVLKELGADLYKPTNNGVTPAFIAAKFAHDSTLRVLKELGADLDKSNNNGETPAFIAAQFGHDSTLRVLKEFGADLDKPNEKGCTPVYIAAQLGHDSTLRALKDLGADLDKSNSNGETPAYIAAQLGHDSTLRVLKELGADLDKSNNSGATPAYIAAQLGHDSTLRMLKELGADLDKSNNSGVTSAFIAAQSGHDSTLRVLKELGADLDKPNEKGCIPAFIAAQLGYDSTLHVLKELGADLDKPNNSSATPAYIAAFNGNDRTLCVLKDLGANLDRPNNYGETPAYIAAFKGNSPTLRVLKGLGVDLDSSTINGCTPAYIATGLGRNSILRDLKELGADLDKPMNTGFGPAHLAAKYGLDSTLRVLKDLGADLDRPAHDGVTPLFVAAQNGKVDSVRTLLSFNVSQEEKFKTTKAQLIKFGIAFSATIQKNIEQHLNRHSISEDDALVELTAHDIAMIMGHDEIAQLLSMHEKPRGPGDLGFFKPQSTQYKNSAADSFAQARRR